MPSITLASARTIIDAALAGERSTGERRVAIAVCDSGAHPVALVREDGAAPLLAHIAEAKAFTCVAYGKPTDLVREWAEQSPAWFEGVGNVAQARMGLPLIGSKGGLAIVDGEGNLIGAVGVAGEAGEIDERLAQLGIEAAGYVAIAG